MFRLSSEPIDPAAQQQLLRDESAGACATFEGWVRNRSDGRAVLGLDYEAYGPLALKEGERILAEARQKFPIVGAAATHRVGSLQLGDLAVWVGVTAAHRGAAFDACRYIIDEAKARLPIWKRERYADGTLAWVNAAARPGQNDGNQAGFAGQAG